jgi:hypothetical protein
MPFEITFENIPVGVNVEAVRGGGMAKVRAMEFVSEEDGDTLIERLEAFGSDILARLPITPPLQPSQVQHLLAIIHRDKTATVYVNELINVGMVQPKRSFEKGDAVFLDDIADVHRLAFQGITIPRDAGVLFIFAIGWRRALFYDFLPLLPQNNEDRQYDIEAQFGQLYAYLMFQMRLKITEQQWGSLFEGQWFPFITLKDASIRNLVSYAGNGWPLDDLVDAIAQEVNDSAPKMLARWKTAPSFVDHMSFFEKAVEHYLNRDFISTAAIVYPRIEGLMRSHQTQVDPNAPASQKGLSGSATRKAESERHASTPLLPTKFRDYLQTVYFADFNPNDPKIKVSRNSIGHGVASAAECSLKAATVGLLIADHLCYCFSDASSTAVTGPGS